MRAVHEPCPPQCSEERLIVAAYILYCLLEERAAELATTEAEVEIVLKRFRKNSNMLNKWLYVGGEFPRLICPRGRGDKEGVKEMFGPIVSKEKAEKEARENRQLARQWEQSGRSDMAEEARQRAYEYDKYANSWLYRWFGF